MPSALSALAFVSTHSRNDSRAGDPISQGTPFHPFRWPPRRPADRLRRTVSWPSHSLEHSASACRHASLRHGPERRRTALRRRHRAKTGLNGRRGSGLPDFWRSRRGQIRLSRASQIRLGGCRDRIGLRRLDVFGSCRGLENRLGDRKILGSTAGTGEASGSGMLEGSILAVLSLGRSRLSRCRTSNTESVLSERARFGES